MIMFFLWAGENKHEQQSKVTFEAITVFSSCQFYLYSAKPQQALHSVHGLRPYKI